MKYIAKKFGSLLLTLLLVSFLSFFAFSVIPGDAAKSQLGTEATPERIEALQKEMGLDRPVLEPAFFMEISAPRIRTRCRSEN